MKGKGKGKGNEKGKEKEKGNEKGRGRRKGRRRGRRRRRRRRGGGEEEEREGNDRAGLAMPSLRPLRLLLNLEEILLAFPFFEFVSD